MAYKSIHTLKGLTAISRAEILRVPINLTHMAVGDGNGKPIVPNELATGLVRERYRGPVNRVYQDHKDPTLFYAELVIPIGVGGFTMRELAVFDSNGVMVVVGNIPEAYKPLPAEGAFGDVTVKLAFALRNAEIITLQIDPYSATASQQWVKNFVTAAQVIPGGTVTQILGKKSNADGDYEWKDLGKINVTVDTIAEKQLLAANQTTVDMSVTTTYGLAVYVNGSRLDRGSGAEEWLPDAQNPARLKLGKAYPAGTRVTLVNNEPAGSAAAPLERANNLSDLTDKAKARANLEIFSKTEARQLAPAGEVSFFARSTAPTGWLKANGAAVSRTAYADLFAAIGTTYGKGDGFTTFNLPDLRGVFLRGWDDGRGVDGGRSLGTVQAGAIQLHGHAASSTSTGSHGHTGSANPNGSHNHGASSGVGGRHSHNAWTDQQGQHGHNARAGASGWHAHTAWTDQQGWHGHNASTDQQGQHQHETLGERFNDHRARWGAVGSPNNFGIGSSDWDNYSYLTAPAGIHSHKVSVEGNGAHAHNVGVAGNGEHTHSLSIDASGQHGHNVGVEASGEHGHSVSVGSSGEHGHTLTIAAAGTHSHPITVEGTGSPETRPINIALLACIKY